MFFFTFQVMYLSLWYYLYWPDSVHMSGTILTLVQKNLKSQKINSVQQTVFGSQLDLLCNKVQMWHQSLYLPDYQQESTLTCSTGQCQSDLPIDFKAQGLSCKIQCVTNLIENQCLQNGMGGQEISSMRVQARSLEN